MTARAIFVLAQLARQQHRLQKVNTVVDMERAKRVALRENFTKHARGLNVNVIKVGVDPFAI